MSGKVVSGLHGLTFQNPRFERVSADPQHVGRLAAVYPETEGVTSKYLRALIGRVLAVAEQMPDRLPPEVREAEGLLPIGEALRQVHLPDDENTAAAARERLGFEELFLIQLAAERARRRRLGSAGVVVAYDVEVARAFSASLPFRLTDGQRIAAHQVLADLAAPGPMNRLLQGDVGSGKTVVAAMAALMTCRAGFQCVVMAPTEILARQHHATLEALLAAPRAGPAPAHRAAPGAGPGGRSSRAWRRATTRWWWVPTPSSRTTWCSTTSAWWWSTSSTASGSPSASGCASRPGAMPNFLAMTATPIPRSLALTVYGDVDVSELREMPPGRLPVETRVVPPDQRERGLRVRARAGRRRDGRSS